MTSFKLDNKFFQTNNINTNSLSKAREIFQQKLNKTDVNLGQLETTTNRFGQLLGLARHNLNHTWLFGDLGDLLRGELS